VASSLSNFARFTGQVAFVTGASKGIGRSTAVALAREGANLAVCSLNPPPDLVEELESHGAEVLAASVDIADGEQVTAFADAALERFGHIDVAVANAGVRSIASPFDIDDAEWRRVLDTNLVGTFNTCRAVMGGMRDRGSGRIVTVSSIAGQVGGTLVSVAYSAAKAGIINMTKVLAKELAGSGVTVNCVAPGTIDTPFIGDYDDGRRELLRELIPLGRLGTGEDVAEPILFLASPGAGWITGQTLGVNGGQVL
jgi:3-oxoacyl-[acyl-carrier protein] reductase